MQQRLIVTVLLLLANESGPCYAFRERQSSGSRLRSRKGRLEQAFRRLRADFEKQHPDWSATQAGGIPSTTKAVTPAPLDSAISNLLQLGGAHRAAVPLVANSTDDTLFTVFTDSKFYDTRLAGILETWGRELPRDRFMAISDKKRSKPSWEKPGTPSDRREPGTEVEETKCPPHDHWQGMCCKWSEGIILAQERFEKNPALKWAFFSDDDVYLLPKELAAALRTHTEEAPKALGIFGCSTPTGCSGLCGGGGFALNRAALNRLARKDPAHLLNQEMGWCGKCQQWADQSISMVWKDMGVQMDQLAGLNGWLMKQDDFKNVLSRGGNLLFHYQKTKHQMEALHEMFTGEKLLKEERGPCMEYQGRKVCAASTDPDDVPFEAMFTPQYR